MPDTAHHMLPEAPESPAGEENGSDRSTTGAAARMRLWRKRNRQGRVVFGHGDLPGRTVENLIDAGLLDPAEAEDRQGLAAGLSRILQDLAKKLQ